MSAPFALTYVAEAAPLPSWLSYVEADTLTTLQPYTYPTLDANGVPTVVTGEVLLTLATTAVAQLPVTVDVTYSVGAPYTTEGGDGPTIASFLGATGSAGAFTVGAASQVLAAEVTRQAVESGATAGPSTSVEASSAATPSAVPTTATTSISAAPVTTSVVSVTTSPTAGATTSAAASSSPAASSSSAVLASSVASGSSSSSAASVSSVASSSSAASASSSSSQASASSSASSSRASSSQASSSRASASRSASSVSSSRAAASSRASTSNLPSSLSSSSSSSPSSSAPPFADSSTFTPSQLSRNQIIGVVLGVFFFCILLLLFLVLCLVRRRRLKRESSSHEWDWVAGSNASTPIAGGRRDSGASGSSRGGLWGLAGITGASLKGKRGSQESSPLTGDSEEGDIMSERRGNGLPISVLPARPPKSTTRGGAFTRGPFGSQARLAEVGGLLDPFNEEEEEDGRPAGGNITPPPSDPLHHPNSSLSQAATVTSYLQQLEDGWGTGYGSPVSVAQPRTPATPTHPRLIITGTPPESIASTSAGKRTRKFFNANPVVSEMGWLAGGAIPASTTSTGSSRTSSGVGTGSGSGSRSSAGGSGNGSGSAGARPGGAQASGTGSDSRGSRATSADASPNLAELFYTTPRWLGSRNLEAGDAELPPPVPDSTAPNSIPRLPTTPNQPVGFSEDFESPLVYPLGQTSSRSPHRYSDDEDDDDEDDQRTPHHTPPQRLDLGKRRTSGPGGFPTRDSEGMIDRIAASFGMALSGLGIRPGGGRSRENSNESSGKSSQRHDPYTMSPGRISPRTVSGNVEHAPLARSFTTTTFGPGGGAGSHHTPSPQSSRRNLRVNDEPDPDDVDQAYLLEHHDSFEQHREELNSSPARSRVTPDIRALRSATVTSFGTLGQRLDGSSSGGSNVGSLGPSSQSHSSSSGHNAPGHPHQDSSFSAEGEMGSVVSIDSPSSNDAWSNQPGSPTSSRGYDLRRNTLGRAFDQVAFVGRYAEGSPSGNGSGSGSGSSGGHTQESSGRSWSSHGGGSGDGRGGLQPSATIRHGLAT